MTGEDLARRLGAIAREESEHLLDDAPSAADPLDPEDLRALKQAAYAAFDPPVPSASRWRRAVAVALAVAASVLLWRAGREDVAPVRYALEVELQRPGELRGAPCVGCRSDDFIAVLHPLATSGDRSSAIVRVYRQTSAGPAPIEADAERASNGAFRVRVKAAVGEELVFVVGPPELVLDRGASWVDASAEGPASVTILRWRRPAEGE